MPRSPVWLLAVGVLVASAPARANVVLTEIMYHPASEIDGEEFVEITNSGPAGVSLAGWCLDGVDFCFPGNASLEPGERLVLGTSTSQFATTYGFAPDYLYGGRLQNSGETLTLRDAASAIVDQVTYLDRPPWPVTPDGLGPSLEVVDPDADNSSPRNWRASTAPSGSTPRAPNSVAADGLPPWISDVQHSPFPAPSTPIAVTARVEGSTSPELRYRVDFAASETSRTMQDDGASGDGAAGDGIFGATIPGQVAGKLVRYRITATGPTGSMSHPRDDDTVTYDGTVVEDPDLVTALPVLHWFIHPTDYQQALDHKLTDETEPAVLYHAGKLYDSVQVRVRGQGSRNFPKNHWKVIFPQGHDFFTPGLLSTPVDNIDLQGSYSDKTYLREVLTYQTFRDSGAASHETAHVRLHQNGDFYGLYVVLEDQDAQWLTRNGFDENGAVYQAFSDLRAEPTAADLEDDYEKSSRIDEDYTDLWEFTTAINAPSAALRKTYMLDNLDLPGVLNWIAVQTLVHNNDHPAKNYFVYRDTEGTGRWTTFPWDFDLTFGRNWIAGEVLNDTIWADVDAIEGKINVSPSHPRFGDSAHKKYDLKWNRLINALHGDPDFRAMYFRRLRTLMDTLLVPGRYEATIDALVAKIAPEAALDRVVWSQYGQSQTLSEAVQILKDEYLTVRRTHLFTTHRIPGEIPAAQSAAPAIVLSEIHFAPAGGAATEFVELFNPSTTEAVDLSGWTLDGTDLRFPAGTVILPGKYLVVVADEPAFRAAYGGNRFLPARFEGRLADEGERVVLRDRGGRQVAAVTYAPQAPWPASPAGQGPSLELVDATRENGWVSNWAASPAPGGSPGAANGAAGIRPAFPGLYVNEVLPLNATGVLDDLGEREPWIEIHNASAVPVALGGFALTDDLALPSKWTLPTGTTVCGGCWIVLWADGEPGQGPLHAPFRLSSTVGLVALYSPGGLLLDYLPYGPSVPDGSTGRFPDGNGDLRRTAVATPGAANDAGLVPLVLNEYNAVSPTSFLKDGNTDTFWGLIQGNGGDWFELMVTEDRLDARGWSFEIHNDPGGPNETTATLTLSQDPLWSDLRSGTILTVAENLPDDVSFDPASGDWWIHVRAADQASGVYITPQGFDVSNSSSQILIRDDAGQVVFGPAGEGIAPTSGVGSDEVCKLEEDPAPTIHPLSNYKDGTSSTFGSPNRWNNGSSEQDLSRLRCQGQDCSSLDGACTVGVCDGTTGQCVARPRGSEGPGEVSGLQASGVGPTTLSWASLGAEIRYDVVTGRVEDLAADGGVGGATCLTDDQTISSVEDGRPDPPPDGGYYYLVRGQTACGDGSYGNQSDGQPRPVEACP